MTHQKSPLKVCVSEDVILLHVCIERNLDNKNMYVCV